MRARRHSACVWFSPGQGSRCRVALSRLWLTCMPNINVTTPMGMHTQTNAPKMKNTCGEQAPGAVCAQRCIMARGAAIVWHRTPRGIAGAAAVHVHMHLLTHVELSTGLQASSSCCVSLVSAQCTAWGGMMREGRMHRPAWGGWPTHIWAPYCSSFWAPRSSCWAPSAAGRNQDSRCELNGALTLVLNTLQTCTCIQPNRSFDQPCTYELTSFQQTAMAQR
jgi:hypothetical protein